MAKSTFARLRRFSSKLALHIGALVGVSSKPSLVVQLGQPPPAVSPAEQDVHTRLVELADSIARALALLEDYGSSGQDLARMAMATPSPANEKCAFEGLLPIVDKIAEFASVWQAVQTIVPAAFTFLAATAAGNDAAASSSSTSSASSTLSSSENAAVIAQLARVLSLAIAFDMQRMATPTVANDFSYYRRLMPKFGGLDAVRVHDDDDAMQHMTRFVSEPMPLLAAMAHGMVPLVEANARMATALAALCNGLSAALKTQRFADASGGGCNDVCARAMVAALVLFDLVDPAGGAFRRDSPVSARRVAQLVTRGDYSIGDFTGLRSVVQYSSKHFDDATTPDSIRSLFE
jgi:hypothetical protein